MAGKILFVILFLFVFLHAAGAAPYQKVAGSGMDVYYRDFGAGTPILVLGGGHAISHYELGQVYEQMKRPADAKQEYSKFLAMCSQADAGWPPVEAARKRLAAL